MQAAVHVLFINNLSLINPLFNKKLSFVHISDPLIQYYGLDQQKSDRQILVFHRHIENRFTLRVNYLSNELLRARILRSRTIRIDSLDTIGDK